MTSVTTMEKAAAHSLQSPSLKVPHATGTSNGKLHSQSSPIGSPSVRKKATNATGNNMSVKPIPVLSVSSFYELSASLSNGKMDHFEKYHGRVTLVVNMATCDKNTKQELTQVYLSNILDFSFLFYNYIPITVNSRMLNGMNFKNEIF